MISCLNEVTMQAYFDGELEPAVAAQVNKHLARCDSCAADAFEFERAIELMASAFEDELPDSIPSEHLRRRIAAALAGDSIPERLSPRLSFWRQMLDAQIARLKTWGLSPRGFAYVSFGLLVLVFGLWLGLRSGALFGKPGGQAKTEKIEEVPPSPAPPDDRDGTNQIANEPKGGRSKKAGIGTVTAKPGSRHAASREYASVEREAPIETDSSGDSLAGMNDTGIFGAGMVRHFEKAQILLRSFRNSDASGEGFAVDLAYEKRQSRSLLYQNILLRRDAETSGNLPAEEVLGSLEPVLLDIANLPDRPSSDEVRSIKDRMHKKEIIGVLQVYSAPLTATSYQPY